MTTSGRIELMAPAGNFRTDASSFRWWLRFGHFGVEQLNMQKAHATVNFRFRRFAEIARRCKKKTLEPI